MELDEMGKGFISKKDLIDFMRTLGEPLSEEEMAGFMNILPHKPGDANYILVAELAKILLPDIEVKNQMA
jgi:Ca2+-binding EF-hand superfamily protein